MNLCSCPLLKQVLIHLFAYVSMWLKPTHKGEEKLADPALISVKKNPNFAHQKIEP